MADVLIVDDEAALRSMLIDTLGEAGHEVRAVSDAAQLRAALLRNVPEIVILDIGLPGEDGLTIARWLRAEQDTGIIMLTGAGDLVDRVVGLELGADDYVTKPFSVAELLARIAAVLRRRRFRGQHFLSFGPLSVDLHNWAVLNPDGSRLDLAPAEIDLIAAFATSPGKLLTRDDLLRLAPANGLDPLDRSIDTRVARLRRKLEAAGCPPDVIETSRGNGYLHAGPVG